MKKTAENLTRTPSAKKLHLNRETLTAMGSVELDLVAGGGSIRSVNLSLCVTCVTCTA